MIRFSVYISVLFIFNISSTFGQFAKKGSSTKVIQGIVTDGETNLPLEFATVAIYTSLDSTLVGGGITEPSGIFRVEADCSACYAELEFIGYESVVIPNIQFEDGEKSKDLGSITMMAGGISLEAVQVTAERSELEFSLDKKVFNVGKDLSGRGGNAADVLDNIPSVNVGVEGDVELRGSGNVRILVDGRPSGLIGLGDTNGLRNIPSNMIEKIEVITNPSSKYEAEGMSGIINIILKKERAGGFNGSFELTGGNPTRYGGGAILNYRKKDLNWFLNYNYQKRTGPATGRNYSEFYRGDSTIVSLQQSRRDRSGYSHAIRFGSDYFITDKQVLTGAFLYRYGKDDNDNFVTYRDSLFTTPITDRLTEDDFDRYILRTDDEFEEEPTLEYSLNYDNQFGKDHKLTANISYQSNTENEGSDLQETLRESENIALADLLTQRSANEEGQKNLRFQLDYEKGFGNIKTGTGLFGNFRQINNDFKVETLRDGVFEDEEFLTNNFIYDEDVLAAYGNFGQEFKKWSYQVGLRGEYSLIRTNLVKTNEVNERDYPNLFPSLFFNYKLGGNNTIQANYSRRIRRPRFWDLNPFFTFTDRRNFFAGNPNLDPEFTDSYELGHLKYWEKGNIGSSVYYRRTTDLITRILTQREGTIDETIRIPINLGIENVYGFEFIWAFTGIDWMRLDGSINGFRFQTQGTTEEGQNLEVDNRAWDGKVNARIDFWNDGQFQMRLNYRSPRNSVQGSRRSITSLNLSASKDFLNKNLTVTLSVRDVFNNRRRQSEIFTETLFQESDFQWRPRTLIATLNYRINTKKQRPKRGGSYEGGGGEF